MVPTLELVTLTLTVRPSDRVFILVLSLTVNGMVLKAQGQCHDHPVVSVHVTGRKNRVPVT